MFKWLNSYRANNIVQFSCTIKTKVFAEESNSNGIIEAKESYIQQSFGKYKGKLVLRNLSPSLYITAI